MHHLQTEQAEVFSSISFVIGVTAGLWSHISEMMCDIYGKRMEDDIGNYQKINFSF
jgi:hypothetical protein